MKDATLTTIVLADENIDVLQLSQLDLLKSLEMSDAKVSYLLRHEKTSGLTTPKSLRVIFWM